MCDYNRFTLSCFEQHVIKFVQFQCVHIIMRLCIVNVRLLYNVCKWLKISITGYSTSLCYVNICSVICYLIQWMSNILFYLFQGYLFSYIFGSGVLYGLAYLWSNKQYLHRYLSFVFMHMEGTPVTLAPNKGLRHRPPYDVAWSSHLLTNTRTRPCYRRVQLFVLAGH
jgi:hypothetical protein